MEEYSKIIESLNIKFSKAKHIKIVQAATVVNHYDTENYLFMLHEGELLHTKNGNALEKGDILFVPGGKMARIGFGKQSIQKHINNEEYISNREKYFESVPDIAQVGKLEDSFSYISFEAKVFDSINFFTSLDIPPFIISGQPSLSRLVKELVVENIAELPGKPRAIKIKTEQLVIDMMRYVLREGMFVEQLATNVTYFKDLRLIDIFNYIREYISTDLSNKILANVANVSEDYVGQYFKSMTGINPQDYIEYQQIGRAHV